MSNINTLKELLLLRDRLRLIQSSYISEGITVGDFTYGKPKIYFKEQGAKLSIGKYCSISEYVTIFLGGEHRTNWVSTYPFHAFITEYLNIDYSPTKGDVIIGNDVWIASGVTILSGVKIGNGVAIGTNSLITKDIPDYAIVGGIPAKVIKYRFDFDTIEKLLNVEWWNWSLEDISEVLPIILSENIDELLNYYNKNINNN